MTPIKGRITTPTSDLSTFIGQVTNREGHQVGTLQGYCVTLEDATGTAECTTTFFLRGSQLTLVVPWYNRDVHARFAQGVAAGAGRYQNARGQAMLTLQSRQDVDYDITVIC